MDRNGDMLIPVIKDIIVALRKESVDRNVKNKRTAYILRTSLSARRAWIEIFTVYIVLL